MTTDLFKDIEDAFERNQVSVTQLINFDRILLDFCIMQVESLEARLKNNDEIKLTNVQWFPTATITALKTIRQNDSMRPQYEDIFNQSVILSVSHFSSAIHSIFRRAINYASRHSPHLLSSSNEDIKITFDELKMYNFNLTENLGDLVIKKKILAFKICKVSTEHSKILLILIFKKINIQTISLLPKQGDTP
jgi:hypothetical protein